METNELSVVTEKNGDIRFITKAQLVERSSLSLATVNRYIRKGLIPVIKFGARVLIDVDFLYRLKGQAANSIKESGK